MTPWFMLVAPQGTPSSVVDKLNQLVNDLLKQPDVRQALIAAGIETEGGTQVEAQSYFLQQRERLARTVRDLKISLRN
jgi:tripartite-type tricarboxylate transporter receptor subunit TctC